LKSVMRCSCFKPQHHLRVDASGLVDTAMSKQSWRYVSRYVEREVRSGGEIHGSCFSNAEMTTHTAGCRKDWRGATCRANIEIAGASILPSRKYRFGRSHSRRLYR